MTNNQSSSKEPKNLGPGKTLKDLCLQRRSSDEKPLTQKEFAKASGINETTISKLFNGFTGKPSLENVLKIVYTIARLTDRQKDEIWSEICSIYEKSDNSQHRYSEEEKDNVETLLKGEFPEEISSTNEANKVKHNLPRKPDTCVGREKEIHQLFGLLQRTRGKPVVIAGIGGLGKTTLALEFAYRCLDSPRSQNNLNFNAIIFTTAKRVRIHGTIKRHRRAPDLSLVHILEKISATLLEDSIRKESNIKSQQRIVEEILKNRDHRILLIIDNLETIEDQDDVLDFVYHILDETDKVKVLITTRNQAGLKVHIPLEKLSPTKSLDLIRRQINMHKNEGLEDFDLTEEEEKELQENTDGIPLAIEYAVGLMARSSGEYSLRHILDELQSPQGELTNFLFNESIDQLRQSKDALGYNLLMAMSIIVDPMRKDAIKKIANLSSGEKSDLEISDSLVELLGRSLISKGKNRGEYSMNSLTRECAKSELYKNTVFCKTAIENWVKYYVEFAETSGSQGIGDWEQGDWSGRYDLLNSQWDNLESVIDFCYQQDLYAELKSIWIALHYFTEVYARWDAHCRWLSILAQQAISHADEKTFIFAKSAQARVHIRANSKKDLEVAENLLAEASIHRKRTRLPIAIQAEFLESQMMLHIEREEYDKARSYVDELETLIAQSSLERDPRIRYMLIVKYRKGQIFSRTGFSHEAGLIFREGIRDAEVINWIRARIALQTRLADLLIEEVEENITLSSVLDIAQKAEELLDVALADAERNKYDRRAAYCHYSLAKLYRPYHGIKESSPSASSKRSNYLEKASDYADKALKTFKRFDMKKQKEKVEKLLSEIKTSLSD